MNNLIVIDDTGSPGNISESHTLKSDRKSYSAIFIKGEDRERISNQIIYLINFFNLKGHNITELHFSDLLNRRSEFEKFNSDEVLYLFQAFVEIVKKQTLVIFHQTATTRTLEENGLNDIIPLLSEEEKNPEYLALHLITSKISLFLENNNYNGQFDIVIDEGLKKDGQNIDLQNFWLKEVKYKAIFKKSHNFVLLQLADFYAFSINRMQMLGIKEKRTTFDIAIMRLISEALISKQIFGLKGEPINPNNFSKEDYDKAILESFKENGNLEYWKLKNKYP